jgi:hypothetical protein
MRVQGVNVTRTTGIAAALTEEGHQTKRGGRWQATQVARLLHTICNDGSE